VAPETRFRREVTIGMSARVTLTFRTKPSFAVRLHVQFITQAIAVLINGCAQRIQ
jgi:hypothetical protein